MTTFAVTAVGMATSLGLDSVDSCAGARAGLVRMGEIPTVNAVVDPSFAKETLGLDGIPPFVGHMVPVVAAGYCGLAKLLTVSKPALEELVRRSALSSGGSDRTGLLVTLSDGYFQRNFGEPEEDFDESDSPSFDQEWAEIVRQFPHRLCSDNALAIPERFRLAVAGGRVGLIDLLRRAAVAIRGGHIDRCIIGGVESCIEPSALRAYAAAGVLKTGTNPVGFLAGEAAAYFLIEAAPDHCRDDCVCVGATSEGTDFPYFQQDRVPGGRGIARTIADVLASDRPEWPRLILSDLNGTETRAADWGSALVLLRAEFGDPDFQVWLPAASFGETGAAAGPIAIGMAVRASCRHYAPGRRALVTLSSEDGRRGAVLLNLPGGND